MSDQNYLFGRGKVYIALESDGFANPAYRYIGQTPGFEITLSPDRNSLKSSDSPSRETVASVVIENEMNGTITCHNINKDNLALFTAGDVSLVEQSSGSFSYSIANVKQGFDYQLGETATNLDGYKDVASVAVSGAVAGTDFTIDAVLGLFQVVRGSTAITEGSTISVTGTKASREWNRVSSSDKGEVLCRLKFIADNASGENDTVILPRVSLAPSGTYNPQSDDDWATVEFEFEVLKTANERILIDGKAVAP